MPPHVPRKRSCSPAPPVAQRSSKRAKATVFDALDASAHRSATAEDYAFLNGLGSDGDSSGLSDPESDDDFEDVPLAPGKTRAAGKQDSQANGAVEDDDDDDMDWEDALPTTSATPATDTSQANVAPWRTLAGATDDALEITLGVPQDEEDEAARTKALGIKGPSKKDRQLRMWTHCVHVQCLLFHNALRNAWCCDDEVYKVLLRDLPEGVQGEIQRWRKDSGMPDDERFVVNKAGKAKRSKNASKEKGKGKQKSIRQAERNVRDWGETAERQEQGVPNMSGGDPLNRLLKYLAAYWKKRFRITAPGLRKKGYFPSAKSLATEVKAWKDCQDHEKTKENEGSKGASGQDEHEFGEIIRNKDEFIEAARRCEGSRDVGAQLFTALLRGLGLETRLVCNLQPLGFGFTKAEDTVLKKKPAQAHNEASSSVNPAKTNIEGGFEKSSDTPSKKNIAKEPKAQKPVLPSGRRTSTRTVGTKPLTVDISDDSDSSLSSIQSISSDPSVVDVTPSKPVPRQSGRKFDADLPFPLYWTEVLSPITHIYTAVSPLVISTVASTSDLLASFEPRGAAADKAKQVIAYVVAHSPDGTAKDVTVRYLKKHIWPGKTKGFRMPVEKIPIHNRRGKVKRYEEYDWFKDVMRGYTRDDLLRTKADEVEDEGDLVLVKPAQAKKNTGDVPETLQGYKNSAEYVLERHLHREEAIRPDAKPIKTFTTGKGDKAKSEPVFLRKDVVSCKTVESWHKEGRQIKLGEQPMKHVPTRAVTLIRKLEIEAAERESGEKPTQGLYAEEQTEWIIPPPIQDGVIPKNAFGNMDVYVPTMVPKGAVHIPFRSTAPICRKLGIDYAEACTGFEFGNRRAVPVLTGVVVAEENEQLVKDAWRAAQEAQRAKEDKKRQDKALKMWKKFILGLRIIERVREEYGDAAMEAENPFAKKERKGELANTFHRKNDDEMEEEGDPGPGGFFAPGEEDAGEGGFLRDEDGEEEGGFVREDDNDAEGGGFIIEGDNKTISAPQLLADTSQGAPVSLRSIHQTGTSSNIHKEGNADDGAASASDDEEPNQPIARGTRGRGRGRGRGGGTRGAAAPKANTTKQTGRRKSRNTITKETTPDSVSEALSSPSNALSADEEATLSRPDAEPDSSPPPKHASPEHNELDEPILPSRSAPTRRAARKSAAAVRSQFFEEDSESDGEAGEALATRSGRGRGRGRGRAANSRRGKTRG
ncbi:Rad4 transglutaminase-like domain-containing protein [Phyllosticta citricarpa]